MYPEIQQLQKYFQKAPLRFERHLQPAPKSLIWVDFMAGTQSWSLLVDDEYGDFSENSPLMCLFLILFSLEIYRESSDYLQWCKQQGLDATRLAYLDYYRSLEEICRQIEAVLGPIDSCIPPLDYQLRTGIIEALREQNPE
ncbi:MAG: hypothetical protein AAF990_02340 [Bacteroidota bacterium]